MAVEVRGNRTLVPTGDVPQPAARELLGSPRPRNEGTGFQRGRALGRGLIPEAARPVLIDLALSGTVIAYYFYSEGFYGIEVGNVAATAAGLSLIFRRRFIVLVALLAFTWLVRTRAGRRVTERSDRGASSTSMRLPDRSSTPATRRS